jgi:hypothetical protein
MANTGPSKSLASRDPIPTISRISYRLHDGGNSGDRTTMIFVGNPSHHDLMEKYCEKISPKFKPSWKAQVDFSTLTQVNLDEFIRNPKYSVYELNWDVEQMVNTEVKVEIRILTEKDYQYMKEAVDFPGTIYPIGWNESDISGIDFQCKIGMTYKESQRMMMYAEHLIIAQYGQLVAVVAGDSDSLFFETVN